MIRVLHVVPNMHAAGLETLIMNIYRKIDRSKVQFDFLVHYKEKHFYDEEIESLGGKIYRLSFRNDGNIAKYIRDLDNFFRNNHYEIVHGHMGSTACFYLGMAKKYKVPIRILHSHNTSTEKNIKGIIKQQMLKVSTLFANEYFACGKKAGEFLYKDKEFTIIHNAIDLEKFKPNAMVRDMYRKEMNLEDKVVIGHIGRFNSQKNHKFILDMFSEFCKRNQNSNLILIGEGETESDMKKYAVQLGIDDKVIFLGVKKNINELYNIMDIFILPSLFEGLPVVGVECQAAGKKTLLSNTITNEISLTSLVEFLPIQGEKVIENWVDKLEEKLNENNTINIEEIHYKLFKNGYEINTEAQRIEKIYIDFLKKQRGAK